MRAEAGFVFCEGGNVIGVVKSGEAYGSFQSEAGMCCHEGVWGVVIGMDVMRIHLKSLGA